MTKLQVPRGGPAVTRIEKLRAGVGEYVNRSTRRALTDRDLARFVRLVRRYPGKSVRVYSETGFVPNSYRHRCEIQRITRDSAGKITVGWSGAQRSGGSAPLETVNNRGIL